MEWYALHMDRVLEVTYVTPYQGKKPPQWFSERFPNYVMGDFGALVITYEPVNETAETPSARSLGPR